MHMNKEVDLELILKEKDEKLYDALKDIEKFSIGVWKDRLLPWFTNHDTDHSKEIIHHFRSNFKPISNGFQLSFGA